MGDRLALITAGMSTVGEAIATKLADAYYRIAVTYAPGNEAAREWVANMYRRYYEVHAYECDVRDCDSCHACVAAVTRDCGPVDILINNPAAVDVERTSAQSGRARSTGLDPLSNVTKQVCGGMMERGWGRIINIASANGFNGAMAHSAFAPASGAIHRFTRSLAQEVARAGVTVNTISTGGKKSDREEISGSEILARSLLARRGAGEEIPAVVLYLCSNAGAALTGATIAVDGVAHLH